MAEPVARKPSGRNVLPILKVCRQARGERHQLLKCLRLHLAPAALNHFSAAASYIDAGATIL